MASPVKWFTGGTTNVLESRGLPGNGLRKLILYFLQWLELFFFKKHSSRFLTKTIREDDLFCNRAGRPKSFIHCCTVFPPGQFFLSRPARPRSLTKLQYRVGFFKAVKEVGKNRSFPRN